MKRNERKRERKGESTRNEGRRMERKGKARLGKGGWIE